MADYYEYSIPELIKLLGARFKDYRLRSNMTQKDVSEQSGITLLPFTSLRTERQAICRLLRSYC